MDKKLSASGGFTHDPTRGSLPLDRAEGSTRSPSPSGKPWIRRWYEYDRPNSWHQKIATKHELFDLRIFLYGSCKFKLRCNWNCNVSSKAWKNSLRVTNARADKRSALFRGRSLVGFRLYKRLRIEVRGCIFRLPRLLSAVFVLTFAVPWSRSALAQLAGGHCTLAEWLVRSIAECRSVSQAAAGPKPRRTMEQRSVLRVLEMRSLGKIRESLANLFFKLKEQDSCREIMHVIRTNNCNHI